MLVTRIEDIMLFILLLCMLAAGSESSPFAFVSCKTDGDCPDNHYCYNVSYLCAPCRPDYCKDYNRHDSWRKCHRDAVECGSCLPGFEEEIFLDGTAREYCLKTYVPPTTVAIPTISDALEFIKNQQAENKNDFSFSWLLVPALLVVIVFLTYGRYVKPVGAEITQSERESLPMRRLCGPNDVSVSNNIYPATAPMLLPGYSREDPYNPGHNISKSDTPDFGFLPIGRKPSECNLVQAAVFRKPDYPEEIENNNWFENINIINVQNQEEVDQEEEEEEEEVQEEAVASNSNVFCPTSPIQNHDETTMPSNWTPGPPEPQENTSNPSESERVKRSNTDMGTSDSDEEQNSKRARNNNNNEQEREQQPRTSSILPNILRFNFRGAFSSVRNNNSPQQNPQEDLPPEKDIHEKK